LITKKENKVAKYSNLKEGQTVNILYKGVQTTAIIIHKSSIQIDVRFWNPFEKMQEGYRAFTTNGKLRYISNENSAILSPSL
jgi:asparagine N-glycosylation enzyme membrane subunit Stt3